MSSGELTPEAREFCVVFFFAMELYPKTKVRRTNAVNQGAIYLKGAGAIGVQIAGTSRRTARSSATRRRHAQRKIVTIDKTNVVEIVTVGAVECDFRQGRRRVAAGAIALEHAPAITSQARPRPRVVEIAP